ncbi:universal stress protein [Sphingomonas oryzagri]
MGEVSIEAFLRRDAGDDGAVGDRNLDNVATPARRDLAEAVEGLRADDGDTFAIHWQIVDRVPPAEWTEGISLASLVVVAAGAVAADAVTRSALVEAGRPVLWTPMGWRRRSAGFPHVAIGVERDASERSALFAATPWLSAAERVTAIRIGELDLSHEQPAREELFDGVEPEWHCVARDPDVPLGDQIVAEAESVHADLLVCGAYRSSGLLEWLLGGTTREIMSRASLPILMAHGT